MVDSLQNNEHLTPNYRLRRIGVGLASAALAAGVGISIAAVTHTDTLASRPAQIAARDIEGGETLSDVTRTAVRDAAESLVDSTNFPTGITQAEKAAIIDSSANAADELIANSGDVSRKKVVVDLDKGFFTTYEVKAHLAPDDNES